jgi:excinuclease ABC subunit C
VGVFLRIRDGRVVSREHSFLENTEEEEEADLLSFLLIRSYIPMSGRVRRLILPLPPAGIESLQDLLPDTQWHIPQRGTARRWLDLAMQNARHLMESLRLESLETDERAGDPVYALGRDLGLSTVPRSMVCIDISTNQGKDTVGALVWFEAGRPKKGEYRRFRIKGTAQQDDYAAIAEVVSRFLARRREESRPMPDLIVIDGGKGQLAAAVHAASALGMDALPMISLAKREEEVFFRDRSESLRLPRSSPALQLLQRMRDEAHRFGVAYNRQRRTARTITSQLLDVPGIGPSRRRLLLERFGSLAGVRSASPAELAALPGFSLRLANRVLESLAGGLSPAKPPSLP